MESGRRDNAIIQAQAESPMAANPAITAGESSVEVTKPASPRAEPGSIAPLRCTTLLIAIAPNEFKIT